MNIADNSTRKKRAQYTDKVHRAVIRAAKRNDQEALTYRTLSGVRNGFLVSDDGGVMCIRLIGDLQNKFVRGKNRKFVELDHVRQARINTLLAKRLEGAKRDQNLKQAICALSDAELVEEDAAAIREFDRVKIHYYCQLELKQRKKVAS